METINFGSVNLDAYKYYDTRVKMELEEKEDDFKIIAETKKVRENSMEKLDNSINISLLALNNLGEIGFNKKSFSTIALADLIEEVYHERSKIDDSDYFDLSNPENIHYKHLADRFMIGNKDIFRGLIASAIGTSNCENKNINDIVFGVTENIVNQLNQKNAKTISLENVNPEL